MAAVEECIREVAGKLEGLGLSIKDIKVLPQSHLGFVTDC
jgi:hypothetical protein